MKRNKSLNMVCGLIIVAIITNIITSCNGDTGTAPKGSPAGDSLTYCDTNIYKKIYSKDGFVLLKEKNYVPKDSSGFLMKSDTISDDTAARMVRYFNNKPLKRKFPIVIDFDITSVNQILAELTKYDTEGEDKKGLRIYLGAYDKKSIELLHSDLTEEEKEQYMNYMTAILVGRYAGTELTKAHDLGNLCPPNCQPPGAKNPEKNTSRIYRYSLDRNDVPVHEEWK